MFFNILFNNQHVNSTKGRLNQIFSIKQIMVKDITTALLSFYHHSYLVHNGRHDYNNKAVNEHPSSMIGTENVWAEKANVCLMSIVS